MLQSEVFRRWRYDSLETTEAQARAAKKDEEITRLKTALADATGEVERSKAAIAEASKKANELTRTIAQERADREKEEREWVKQKLSLVTEANEAKTVVAAKDANIAALTDQLVAARKMLGEKHRKTTGGQPDISGMSAPEIRQQIYGTPVWYDLLYSSYSKGIRGALGYLQFYNPESWKSIDLHGLGLSTEFRRCHYSLGAQMIGEKDEVSEDETCIDGEDVDDDEQAVYSSLLRHCVDPSGKLRWKDGLIPLPTPLAATGTSAATPPATAVTAPPPSTAGTAPPPSTAGTAAPASETTGGAAASVAPTAPVAPPAPGA